MTAISALVAALAIVFSVIALLRGRQAQRDFNEAAEHLTQKADDSQRRFMDLHTEVLSTLPVDGVRYEVLLADWGPDFLGPGDDIGNGDILPRWRWQVVDADRDLRHALGIRCEIGTKEAPYMLGNALTSSDAVRGALLWVDQQGDSDTSVVFSVGALNG